MLGSPFGNVGDDAHIVPAVLGGGHRCTGANAYHDAAGASPRPTVCYYQANVWFLVHTGSALFGGAACGPMWASAPTGCIRFNKPYHYKNGRCTSRLDGTSPDIFRNNAKHGFSGLLHLFGGSAPNHLKNSKPLKFYSIFFKKSQGSRGQRPRSRLARRETPLAGASPFTPRTSDRRRWARARYPCPPGVPVRPRGCGGRPWRE